MHFEKELLSEGENTSEAPCSELSNRDGKGGGVTLHQCSQPQLTEEFTNELLLNYVLENNRFYFIYLFIFG